MNRPKKTLLLTLTAIGMAATFAVGRAEARISINGYLLAPAQIQALEQQLGVRLAAGDYLVDAQGCWANLTNGTYGCPDNSFEYQSRYGSGARSADGTWNHWSDAADGGVGGTADGCIYTTYGWSNC